VNTRKTTTLNDVPTVDHAGVVDLRKAGLISAGALGAVFGVGPGAVNGAARRLGIRPKRLANGRGKLSFEQAEVVAQDLQKNRS
jgi:hypothetical protein